MIDQYELMERICEPSNLNRAFRAVKRNKGAAGVDGKTIAETLAYLQTGHHARALRESLLQGEYQPQAVRGVHIPKPDGGSRQLGIPTVIDRWLQQAIAQVLTGIYEPQFSASSFGFRPGRGAHDALRQAQGFVESGKTWVVDLDLEKYFDTVNHDRLMARLSRDIKDKRVLKLIRRYLQAGMLQNGVILGRQQGTPQGGPLSPLLANIVLDELDKELERRGHRFCRYADDCQIYVGSQKAGERVLASVTDFLERKLKRILDASPSDGGVGIPIGNLTSQIFANLYLNDIDHWLTGEPACGAYLRYVDDLYLLGDSKAGLWRLRDQLARRLKALGLEIHPRKCTLQPTAQRVDILGYQVSPMKRWLRNDNGYRAQRRLKRLAARYRQGQVSRDTVRQSVASWLGHAHHADCDALLEQILAGVVFQRM